MSSSSPDIVSILENSKELDRLRKDQEDVLSEINKLHKKLQTRFVDPMKICCGYHVNDTHIWCGNLGTANGKDVYGTSCEKPSMYVSWDGVHYAEAANHWVADRILNGTFTDPATPILQACYRH